MLRSRLLAPLLCLTGLTAASAQPVEVKLSAPALQEGRPAELKVVLENDSTRPLLLVSCRVTVTQDERTLGVLGGDLTRVLQGLTLASAQPDPLLGLGPEDEEEGDRVVTLTLRAIDDPGPAARLPLPDRVSTAQGEEHRLVPLLTRRSEELSFRPRVGPITVEVEWSAIPVPREIPAGIYELGRERTWRPEASPEDERSAGPQTLLRMTTRHWRPWRGELRGELLLRQPTFAGLSLYRGTLRKTLSVRAARFGLADALASAKLGRDAEGWRLSDGRWILQRGERYALVAEGQPPRIGHGDLRLLADRLAAGRALSYTWDSARENSELEVDLEGMFEGRIQHAKSGRRGLVFEVDERSLAPFLDLVRENKVEAWGDRLQEPSRP